jgi:osmotically-inducible protein OsmY
MGSVTRGDFAKVTATETTPRAETRADAYLVADVKARLAEEAWASHRGIWIEAREGTIALIGVVNSEREKATLEAMARGVDGCKAVENHLLVKSKWRDYGLA